MKVIWEADDIYSGLRFGIKGCSESWIVGYLSTPVGDKTLALISIDDHMISEPQTQAEIAASLTSYGYLPSELL